MSAWIYPGAAEFGATSGFFGGDAEGFAGAFADVFPVFGKRAEVVRAAREC